MLRDGLTANMVTEAIVQALHFGRGLGVRWIRTIGSGAGTQPQRRARRRPGRAALPRRRRRHPPAGRHRRIRAFFAANPGFDLFVGRSLDPDGRPRKPSLPRRGLTRLNGARASSHEIAVRLSRVRAAGVRFDVGFGVGAGTAASLGEE